MSLLEKATKILSKAFGVRLRECTKAMAEVFRPLSKTEKPTGMKRGRPKEDKATAITLNISTKQKND